MKNTHQSQLVNVQKLYKVLGRLKRNGNPHYQFYDDYNVFKGRFKEKDPDNYNLVFESDDVYEELERAFFGRNLADEFDSEYDSQ